MNLTNKHPILILLFILLSAPSFGQYKMYRTNNTEPINNCFCYYSSQLSGLLYNIDLAQTGAELVLKHWLREQESLMKNEIQRRLNQEFGSYGAAQKEFFKQRFGDLEAPQWINQWRNTIHSSQDRVREKMNSQFKRHQFFELRRNDLTRIRNGQSALYDFGDLKYGDTKIEDLPSSIIGNLSSTNKEFYDDNMIAYVGYLHMEKQLDKVNAEDKLAYAIANRFISHYRNHNQIDKVILMSGYLIADNSNLNPTGLGGGVSYYNYMAVDWYDQLSQLVDNTNGVPYPRVSDPNYDARELMAEYAINEMRSTAAKNYLLPRNQLKQGLEDYYYHNRYKQNALDFAERFFNGYATGGIYYPDWEVYRSNSLGYQTEDRPEHIFSMEVSSKGKEEGLDAFSYVLNKLSEQGARLDHEGTMMRTMMAANGYWVPSSISEEELGKVFDFDGGRQYIKIEFSSEARQRIDRLRDPNGNYGKSLFTDPFKIEAVKALAAGGEVDFNRRRINGIYMDANLPNCVTSLILNLMLKNPENINKTELIDRVFSILGTNIGINDRDFTTTYKMGNISGNGSTTLIYNSTSKKYEATITLSENLINNGTKLAIAKTILHESIHVFLKYTAKQFPSTFTDPNGDFSTLIAAWQVHNDENYAHHVYMANLIEDIAKDIGTFVSDNYFYPDYNTTPSILNHYESVAWSGIALISDPNGTAPYIKNPIFIQNYPSTNDQDNIIKIFNTENGSATYPGYSPLINNNCN